MVVTTAPYTDPRCRAYPGEGFDGVVRVSFGGYYGMGVLLYDGRAVLTAAHLLQQKAPDGTEPAVTVHFETAGGTQSLTAVDTTVIPNYDPVNSNNDLALVWLSSAAPQDAERYGIYRASDEIGRTVTLVGYGMPGSGETGIISNYSGPYLRLEARNRIDADVGTVKSMLGNIIAWAPTAGTQLVADFDNGTTARDAWGCLIDRPDTGLGQDEGLISRGDSGGPAFIGGQVAGIASYTASLEKGGLHPDIDDKANSSFGEIASWQRVSAYQEWIDQSLRAHYPNAPTTPAEVQTSVVEGNAGTTYAYFLLQFTGVRSSPDEILSVDYATRDGTATATEDYLPVTGKLILYPDENQAVIPVEIAGDTWSEADETFYLDVFNPVGGSFGAGVEILTAMRTIVNDDGWWTG